MKTFQLEGKSREVAATSADQKRALKAMRKNNEIPAVLYGGEKYLISPSQKTVFVTWFTALKFLLLN